jgi:hypothetical protein
MEDPNMGYNAAADEFTDMVKSGIIDPLKVRCCLGWVASGLAALGQGWGCVRPRLRAGGEAAACVEAADCTPAAPLGSSHCHGGSRSQLRAGPAALPAHPPPASPRPAQVVRTALVDAASVSSLITTSECVIVDAPEDKKAPAMPSMDGMY